MSISYEVRLEPFAQRHYIKDFAKKHKKAWDLALSALIREFQSFDVILEKSIAEPISARQADVVICKAEFKIPGTPVSRHASGNRCIVAQHKKEAKIRGLLVYHKSHLGEGNETERWKRMVREAYPEYWDVLG